MRRSFSFPFALRRTPVANALPVTQQPEEPPTTTIRYRGGGGASVPASLRHIGGDSGGYRSADIVDDINRGPAPDMLDRGTRALNAGIIGPGMATWPYDANREYLAHTNIPRNPNTVTPFQRTIDTGVTIPAVAIGGPVS